MRRKKHYIPAFESDDYENTKCKKKHKNKRSANDVKNTDKKDRKEKDKREKKVKEKREKKDFDRDRDSHRKDCDSHGRGGSGRKIDSKKDDKQRHSREKAESGKGSKGNKDRKDRDTNKQSHVVKLFSPGNGMVSSVSQPKKVPLTFASQWKEETETCSVKH